MYSTNLFTIIQHFRRFVIIHEGCIKAPCFGLAYLFKLARFRLASTSALDPFRLLQP